MYLKTIEFTDDDMAYCRSKGWLKKQPSEPDATYVPRGTTDTYRVFNMSTHYKVVGKRNGVKLYHQYANGITIGANIARALSEALGYKVLQKQIKYTIVKGLD